MGKYQFFRSVAVCCVVAYLLAFITFMGFISSSPKTWVENTDLTKIDWGQPLDYNRSNHAQYFIRMFWPGSSSGRNETQLEQQHRNMTILKANMSGVGAIFRHIQNTIMDSALGITAKPVNPHPFEYLNNCPDVCRNVKGDLLFIAYVHTAVDHYRRRMIIRQTWGNMANYEGVNMRLVFVMGKQVETTKSSVKNNGTGKPTIQDAVSFEAEHFGDIVQEDFLDTYHNLTYKGIAALRWIASYCPQAKFVVKADDDIFVNSFMLVNRLKRLLRKGQDHGILMCLVWVNMVVMRTGKWRVDESEWKEKTYPTYCSGSAFIMSTDVALRLHSVSYHVPFFWVDDFYLTGLLPLKAGNIKHTQIASSYLLNGKLLEEKFNGPQWYQYLFSHVHDLNAYVTVWKKMVAIAKGRATAPIAFADPGHLPDVPHKIDP